jgi:conjugal transfer/type IV secretion protein DotA/TraY
MPYFMWLAGVAGWLLMLVQTVVAAPLWAASHVMPEGEGFAGHRAMNGYMMLIALLARPLLMVVGLVAAMLVVKVVGGVIVTTFGWFTSSVSLGASGANPIHLLAWIFLFVGIFIVLARWSFSLIHLVPDTVLRFIGAATESFGETNIAEQAKNTAHSAYRVVSDAVKIGRLPGKPKGGGSNNVPVSGS